MHEAYGSDLEQGTTADYKTNSTWTSVGALQAVTPPTQTTEVIKPPLAINGTTRTKRSLPGATDPGSSSFTVEYEAGKYQAMKDKQGTPSCFRIKLAGTTKAIAFNGFIMEVGMPELNESGFQQVTVQIAVDGDAAEVAVASGGGGA